MTPSTATAGPDRRVRRTQAQRSDATRGALLDATLSLLVEVGYARTTTQAVADRAGVSRGAQLHHFPTRADLVVDAVRHLGRQRQRAIDDTGTDTGLAAVAELFTGPLFLAALELVVAARTDDELRAVVLPFEREVVDDTRRLAAAGLGVDPATDLGRDLVDLTLDLLRGMGVAALLADADAAARRRDRLLQAWQRLLPGDPVPHVRS